MTTRAASRAVLSITTPVSPPYWALLERELLRAISDACPEFYDKYFDPRGYLDCHARWGALDGPDDALENVAGWTMFHALGGSDRVLTLYKQALEGHIRQYTEAKTVDVPFARDGMYYKEFPVMFDFVHTGEGFSPLFEQGLSDPYDLTWQKRMRRYSGFYMNEDPQAPNYDPQRKIIRSLFNGSRGPLLRKATPVDWGGDRFEVDGRFQPLRGERSYEDILEHFEPHTDIVGDSPCNLPITVMPLNAYMTGGEGKYKAWILEYVDAWVERCRANGGIIPSNIGLDGSIGGECGGKWWGGAYGWAFTCPKPTLVHRPFHYGRSFNGFGIALLLTGRRDYVDVWRTVIRKVNENKKRVNGKDLYPHMHGDEGWYDYTPTPFLAGALETWFWSLDRERDLPLVADTPWVSWLEGKGPRYPETALLADLEAVRKRVALMRADTRTRDTRMSEEPNGINPAATDALTELTLGGVPTRHDGCPLWASVRYFDPDRRRAGLPEDIAALVDRVTATTVGLQLVNVSTVAWRTVVVQAGAFAEHRVERIRQGDVVTDVGEDSFQVRLAPGSGCRLELEVSRFVNQPTLAFPWV